jgi:hypothetical protein
MTAHDLIEGACLLLLGTFGLLAFLGGIASIVFLIFALTAPF